MLGQGPAAVGAADVEGLGVEPAEGGMGADIGAVEPGSLLRPDRHHGDVALGRDALAPQPAEGRQPGNDSGSAVVIAALGDRIHMRARHQPRQLAPAARQGHVEVERGVGLDLEAEPLRRPSRQAMGEVLALAIGGAGDAAADAGMGAQRIEHAARQLEVGLDSRPGGHHGAPSRERQSGERLQQAFHLLPGPDGDAQAMAETVARHGPQHDPLLLQILKGRRRARLAGEGQEHEIAMARPGGEAERCEPVREPSREVLNWRCAPPRYGRGRGWRRQRRRCSAPSRHWGGGCDSGSRRSRPGNSPSRSASPPARGSWRSCAA